MALLCPECRKPIPHQKESDKLSKASNADIESFRRMAIGKRWTRHELEQKACELFGKENITIDRMNNNQVCFVINKKRIPEDGYFTVN